MLKWIEFRGEIEAKETGWVLFLSGKINGKGDAALWLQGQREPSAVRWICHWNHRLHCRHRTEVPSLAWLHSKPKRHQWENARYFDRLACGCASQIQAASVNALLDYQHDWPVLKQGSDLKTQAAAGWHFSNANFIQVRRNLPSWDKRLHLHHW